jgi:hypothetical protein
MAFFKNNIDKRFYFLFFFQKKYINGIKKKSYFILKRNILNNIYRKIDRIKKRSKIK